MEGTRVKQDGIAGFQVIGAIRVCVDHFTSQHVDEFHAFMLKPRIGFGARAKPYKVGLYDRVARWGSAEKFVVMADLCASTLNRDAFACLDK